jgi:O-acetyl-ADP-ribose deacetylase (regulator of RNase III)
LNPIVYTEGDATNPAGKGNKVIVHVCNDAGFWGKGFVLAVSRRWKEPEGAYKDWFKNGQDFSLGKVQFVQVENDLWVANLIGQHKITKSRNGPPPIRYEAVKEGLASVQMFAKNINASVHMPRIGCGLAGGTWDRIEPLIQKELSHKAIVVTVYDFVS